MIDLSTIPGPLVQIVIGLIGVLAFVGLNGLVCVYLERKVAGHIQRRPGPFEVGPHGILQPLADAVKLVAKQMITPKGADPILYWAAPLISFAPAIACFLPLPFGPKLQNVSINVGLILILAFSSLNVLALCLAGWSSQNKWSLLGAARDIAQSVAYEIPLLLSLLPIILLTGSLNLAEITQTQGPWPWQWLVVKQPLAFIIFFVCVFAETNRAPFDLPEAESELTAGFHTEYSGMGFGLFFLAEYSYMVVGCALASILFLGGYQGPVASGWWWFLLKVYALLLVMMWVRWTYPRVRFDQLLNLAWKWFIPLSLLNILITALVVKL
ncbi:MAG: NADH-quinone oxidoreductase subunit [Desulfonauticus sp.]|nr:NADH-quinone oxidoreductase subunit [Desulfonauticus sp.]